MKDKHLHISGSMMVFIGALFWSLNSPLVKFLPLDGIMVCGLRSVIAGIVLAPFIRRKQLNWTPWMLVYVVSYMMVCFCVLVALKLTSAPIAIGMQYTSIIWLFLATTIKTKRFNVRGFIPASQLDMGYVEDVTPYVGKTLSVKVTEADKEKAKLILSAKAVLREEAKEEHDHKVAMIVPGTVLEGTVESLQPYGAFVDLGDGLNGLVHISQICQKRIRKPSEVLTVGDVVKAKVLNTNDGKISLSIRAVEEEAEAEERESLEAAEYSSDESVGTSLGDLFAKLNL